ncbi:hypothetical protein Bbelb_053330 [Branchiostoma belcheri]|nr:hypothetical protein Bbelb_053330 [Branchiostoma belcheri]
MSAGILSRLVGLALVCGLASANLVKLTPRTEYVYDYTAQSRLGDIALLVTKAKCVGSCGAVGSAFGSHPRGCGFETCHRSCALGKGTLHDFPHFTQRGESAELKWNLYGGLSALSARPKTQMPTTFMGDERFHRSLNE